ncbi:hypothetical protein KUK79_004505 [Vibrio parahaemolyticus]|nr:hypothetical protein [Vibrio parahaemolyticus]
MEHTYNKVDLAIEQLETGIKLFLNKESYISALTLAGAAEEILGQAVKRKGQENALQEQYRLRTQEKWVTSPGSWSDFTTKNKNKVRNYAKHLHEKDSLEFVADVEDEALWMIVRATENYVRLNLEYTDVMHDFDGWFYEHVVGI